MLFVAKNVFILFALAFIGYVAGVKKIISPGGVKELSNLLIKVTVPLTIVFSMIRPYNPEVAHTARMVVLGCLIYMPVLAAIGFGLAKVFRVGYRREGLWTFMLTFTNNGFLGMPFMYALFGVDGLLFMTLANTVQQLLLYTGGVYMVKRGYYPQEKIDWKSLFITNVNIAIVIGVIIFVNQIPIPAEVVSVLEYMAGMNTPLSMMVVGLSLSHYPLATMFTEKHAYILAFFRLVAFPLLTYAVMRMIGLEKGAMLTTTLLYSTALPSPALGSILAVKYDTDPQFAAQCVFITTTLALLTLPIIGGYLA